MNTIIKAKTMFWIRFVMKMHLFFGLVMSEWEAGHLVGRRQSGGRVSPQVYILADLIQSVKCSFTFNVLISYIDIGFRG